MSPKCSPVYIYICNINRINVQRELLFWFNNLFFFSILPSSFFFCHPEFHYLFNSNIFHLMCQQKSTHNVTKYSAVNNIRLDCMWCVKKKHTNTTESLVQLSQKCVANKLSEGQRASFSLFSLWIIPDYIAGVKKKKYSWAS